ncbi:NAD-dependent dehydratase [Pantoea agglomerans]|uniref:NAD-dependent dehydratase n=1 Tax=Enterobacter agglomerans TaxID=549 RepID=A0ACC5RLB8_ENTAG|nr:NAD-dependent dehydratase [Pantoea agglomerans]MBK4725312.1 NAD-dependent dehydratase [Pantoea agglomerans]
MKLLLAGATGLVGGQVLRLALQDERVTSVVAPVRRALPAHPKLLAPVVNFDSLPWNEPWWQADAMICTLGTTMKKAQTRDAFKRVDYHYPLAIARQAKAQGVQTCVQNSATGASIASRFFYNRVKGELEHDLAQLGFDSLTLVRPGLIGGEREEARTMEALMMSFLRVAGPMLPKRMRLNPAENIARALLESALNPQPGTHIIPAAELV